MPRPRSALTKFILSLPRDLPAKEVMARLKAKGYPSTTEKNVSRVRGMSPAKPAPTPAAPRSAKAKKGPAPKAAPPQAKPAPSAELSKSDFIRRQPLTVAPSDVVASGKAAGVTFSRNLVYLVRGKMAKETKKGAGVAPPKSTAPTPTVHETKSPPAPAKRRAARRRKRSVVAAKAAPAPAVAVTARLSQAATRVEDLLRAVAAEIGLSRASEILHEARASVRTLIGG